MTTNLIPFLVHFQLRILSLYSDKEMCIEVNILSEINLYTPLATASDFLEQIFVWHY